MADTTKLLLLAGAAGAVYYFYFYNPAPAAAAAPPAGVPPPPPPNPNAIQGANSLDGIYGRLASAATGPMGVDAWNTYLAPLLPAGDVPPDPIPIFTAASPGFDRSQPLTIGQYWAVMSPALKSQFGLSGLGMMGNIHMRRGW